jgi:hypothetical protein
MRAEFVWPIKCHIVCVTATANIGMNHLAPSGSGGVAASKASDQPQQPFNETLFAASKAYSEADSANDSNTNAVHRQKSSSEDKEATDADHRDNADKSSVLSQQTVQPQQVIPAPQAQLTGDQLSIAASGNDLQLASSISSGAANQDNETTGTPRFESGYSVSSADADEVRNAATTGSSNELASAVARVATSTDSNDSSAPSDGAAGASTRDGLASTVNSPIQAAGKDASNDAALSGIDSATNSAVAVFPAQSTSTNADASATRAILASSVSDALSGQAISSTTAADQTSHATGLEVSGGTANQLVSPIKPGGGLPGTAHANVSSFYTASVAKQSAVSVANGKDESQDSNNSAAGLKQHVQFTADHAGSQTSTQQDASAHDQSQGGASSQQQSATLPQMNAATNSVVVAIPVQNASSAFAPQSASMHAGVAASTAKLPDAAASASAAVTQATPVINTAKLIQSIGQSEMRVGMRSNEFGNISISTTANKDVISAQISLDHGELAKALAAQLPEMQARLGANQPMDVHIDMYGTATGQGTGTSGGMSNGSYDQSSAGKQQSTYTASSYSGNSVAERPLFPASVATTTGYGSLNARLDIRV